MKRSLLLLACMLFLKLLAAQVDTGKIYNCLHLKKGFYKSYEEYINNAPSVTTNFTVNPFIKSKTDTTVIAAGYSLADTAKNIGHVWGFCDGTNVYVNYASGLFKKRYWKLNYIGAYPFFTFKHKDNYFGYGLAGGAIAIGASAAAPIEFDLMVIDNKGEFREPTVKKMKKLLAVTPNLQKSFTKYANMYQASQPYNYESNETYAEKMRLITDYLIRLNQITAGQATD